MKCQILFSGKNKKNISRCHLPKILPRVLSVKGRPAILLSLLVSKQEVHRDGGSLSGDGFNNVSVCL